MKIKVIIYNLSTNKYMIKFIELCLHLKFKIMKVNYIENWYKWIKTKLLGVKIDQS
jgi:hypothetical protein